jgi:hypothetical protein
MSKMKQTIGELVPGILMLALVLTGVASGEAKHPERVVDEPRLELKQHLQEAAGQLAKQVLTGAGAVISGTADLNDDGELCRSEDRMGSSERQRRSF